MMIDKRNRYIPLKGLTPENVEQYYKKLYSDFMFWNVDEVEIDGVVYGKTDDDKFKKIYITTFSDDGKPRTTKRQFSTDGLKDGVEITELDFIDDEFIRLDGVTSNDVAERKKLKLYIDYLNQRKAELTKHSPQKKTNKTTYVWQGNADKELPELYKLMIEEYKLIAPDTTFEEFEAIFTGKPIDNIVPIKWIKTNRLLAYFLDTFFYGLDWQSIAGSGNLFINSKGKNITANDLSVAKNGYIHFGKPKDHKSIDELKKSIQKH